MGEITNKKDVPRGDLRAKSDFIAAVVIMIFCISVAINSISMPRDEGWSTAAGLVPLILSVSLFMMAIGLLISSIKRDVFAQFAELKLSVSLPRFFGDVSVRKTVCLLALTTGYITLLVGRVPFEVSGFVFLFVAFQMCWKKGSLRRKLVISIVTPVVLAIVFRMFFNIFLPGDTLLELIL